jgi:hypothetical protein
MAEADLENSDGFDGQAATYDQRRNATANGLLWYVLSMLSCIYAIHTGDQSDDAKQDHRFKVEVFDPIRVDVGTRKLATLGAFLKQKPEQQYSYAMLACVEYAASAYNEQVRDDANKAVGWSYADDAYFWLGIAIAVGFAPSRTVADTKQWAKVAASIRHSENRSMKTQVFAWCDANRAKFKSMDATAEAIAGKLVPVKFRTARAWVGEWKKLRSAA